MMDDYCKRTGIGDSYWLERTRVCLVFDAQLQYSTLKVVSPGIIAGIYFGDIFVVSEPAANQEHDNTRPLVTQLLACKLGVRMQDPSNSRASELSHKHRE
jgi:hypothetical protein